MASFDTNPFTLLSLIAAPAVLTNASSVLALGTSNRFARVVDRARALALELDGDALPAEFVEIRMRQLDRSDRRSLYLVGAMSSFYTAVGCFGAASLISLIGAGLSSTTMHVSARVALFMGLLVGIAGVTGIVHGCLLLVRETRLVVQNLNEESAYIRAKRAARADADG